jgi:Tfp pilus assembly protein PilO
MSSAVPLRESLRWTFRRWLHILGRPGVLAIGILVVFPPFYFSAIVPAQERLDAARRSTLSLREQILHAGKSLAGVRRTPAEQLAEFYRIFPEERSSPQWLARLLVLASKNGVSLNEGEYKATRDNAGRLMRLQMVLPVKGEYRQIRRFLAALPAEIPIIALENVQFTRRNVADSAVEARIRLALYLEQAS